MGALAGERNAVLLVSRGKRRAIVVCMMALGSERIERGQREAAAFLSLQFLIFDVLMVDG